MLQEVDESKWFINLHCLPVLHLALLLPQHVHLLQHVWPLPQLPHLQPLLCQVQTAGSEPTPKPLCPLSPLPKPPTLDPLLQLLFVDHLLHHQLLVHIQHHALSLLLLYISPWPSALVEIGHIWRQSVLLASA